VALKTLFSPHHGVSVKMGRKRPAQPASAHLCFANYIEGAALPAPPPAPYDLSPKGQPALSNIYGNDMLGCCVVSGGGHVLATWTGNAGNLFTLTQAQVISDYSAIGGYVPGDPATDQGCDEQTAFKYWMSHGFADGSKLTGWLGVDATDQLALRQALYLFENLYFGLELPDAWTNPMPSGPGFVWDAAGPPDPSQGHCVMCVGFTSAGLTIDTWGMLGTLTWAALAKYCVAGANGETYVLIGPDQINKAQQKAPNGFNWAQLIADFDALGGNVPVPAPVPGPTPTPTPTPTPVPTNGIITLDTVRKIVSVPAGVTTAKTPNPQVEYFPFRKLVTVPVGWTAANH
jgi:hypothetical protein